MADASALVTGIAPRAAGGLLTRAVVGAALAMVAIAAVWEGGVAFRALVATAVLLMSAEWSVMHGIPRGFRAASLVALAFVAGVTVYVSAADALIVLASAAGLLGLFTRGYDRSRAFWIAAGLLYCGLPMVALLWLRAVPTSGAALTGAVLVIVWATDIAAYFAGRMIGGPKLAPRISPKKTWAGAVGGIVAAMSLSAVAGTVQIVRPGELQWQSIVAFAMVGGLFGAVAVAGDLFESWLKRRAGVKDSGNLLPGHGGVLDRIDGLVPVAVIAAVLAYTAGWGR